MEINPQEIKMLVEMLGVRVVMVDKESAVPPQIVQVGPPNVASGAIVRLMSSQMETQMLESVPHLQTVHNGLQHVPSLDIVKQMDREVARVKEAAILERKQVEEEDLQVAVKVVEEAGLKGIKEERELVEEGQVEEVNKVVEEYGLGVIREVKEVETEEAVEIEVGEEEMEEVEADGLVVV